MISHPQNRDHPTVYQAYFDKTPVVTDAEYTIRRHGNISMPFYVHDVIGEQTKKFTPNSKETRLVNVGDPVLLGVKPEPDLDAHGNNKNPIDKYFSNLPI